MVSRLDIKYIIQFYELFEYQDFLSEVFSIEKLN